MVGRQLQVLMDASDENSFISFLRGISTIQILESSAPTADELWVEEFNPSFPGHYSYAVWNKAFEWFPEYGTVGPRAHDPTHIGWRYVANRSAAPLLEVRRTNPSSGEPGRLYWAKDFSAPRGLDYDAIAFSKWIDTIWRWIRKQGKKTGEPSPSPYVLPGAMEKLLPNLSAKKGGHRAALTANVRAGPVSPPR